MGARVLVVDDEPSILRAVAANLRARGYEALTAASGRAALRLVESQQPDCILLDLGLPDVGGLEVLRRLRAWATTPVVIVTAVDDERDKATALDLGADDYVTKPFTMTELLARVRGALRHGQSQNLKRPRSIEVGPVCVDLDAGLVTRWGQPVRLTSTEYRLRGRPSPQARRPVGARVACHRTGHGLPLRRAGLRSSHPPHHRSSRRPPRSLRGRCPVRCGAGPGRSGAGSARHVPGQHPRAFARPTR